MFHANQATYCIFAFGVKEMACFILQFPQAYIITNT